MHLSFLGAARGVTGSMHLVEANGKRVLLDCGLFQGHRAEAAAKNRNLRISGDRVDAIVLSHAHVDHAGNIPTMFRQGFRGYVHATHATADLTRVMLLDSAEVQLRDVEHLRKNAESPLDPLYGTAEVEGAMRRFRSWDYDAWFEVLPGIRCRFRDAGHIIGSASVHLEIREPGRDLVRLTFTGDLGRAGTPILRDPAPLPEAEIVVSESTYGDREHDRGTDVAAEMRDSLREAVLAAVARRGKLLIPAFSVGRTQNVLYFLNELASAREIPPIPVFVDSPLSVEATEVILRHPECFDREALERVERAVSPVAGSRVEFCRTVEQSKRINHFEGSCVVIAASGMCEFGRILHHLAHHLGDERTVVAFVGYQAEHTLGRRIVERQPRVRIYGREITVKARIFRLNGFSAHAGKRELLSALAPLKPAAGRVFLVHGEPAQALPFADTLTSLGFRGVEVPHEGDRIAI